MFSYSDVHWAAEAVHHQGDNALHVPKLLWALDHMRALGSEYVFDQIPVQERIDHVHILHYILSGKTGYRIVPAHFANGSYAIPAPNIERAMYSLMLNWPNLEAEEAYKEFELIHPFSDFNGRIGEILYNQRNGDLKWLIHPPDLFN